MNKAILKSIGDNLFDWSAKAMHETVSQDKKLDLIMFSISELAKALYTDGSQESVEEWYRR